MTYGTRVPYHRVMTTTQITEIGRYRNNPRNPLRWAVAGAAGTVRITDATRHNPILVWVTGTATFTIADAATLDEAFAIAADAATRGADVVMADLLAARIAARAA